VSPNKEVTLELDPAGETAGCPGCGCTSRRVHSWYWRHAGDLPCGGSPVKLHVHVRRFFCSTAGCRPTFAERFDGVLAPYQRRTERAQKVLIELAHASSAEHAARVAGLLGFEASGDTLIRLQRSETFSHPAPAAIGVDEFAWRKRHTYGTLIVDLERHRVLDVLPTDKAEEFAHWLERQPPVTTVARDRDAVFAQAARQVVPDALQVADRFHLVKNMTDAFRTFAMSRRWDTPHADEAAPESETATPPDPEPAHAPVPTPRKRQQWERVQALGKEGLTVRAIARAAGMHRRTVRKYLSATSPPTYRTGAPRVRKIDPHLDYLRQRWAEGVHSGVQLYREIQDRGYDGKRSMLLRAIRSWRSRPPKRDRPAPSPRRLLFRMRTELSEDETAELDGFLELNPGLATAYKLKDSFRTMLSSHDKVALEPWLETARNSGIEQFTQLARGIRQDQAAVSAAFTSPWSTGQCEGQICRLKLIKRVGYGRAKPDLLRVRVLHRFEALERAGDPQPEWDHGHSRRSDSRPVACLSPPGAGLRAA
jgi:transposase